MKQYSSLSKQSPFANGQPVHERFFEPLPFFRPSKVEPLPTATIKSCTMLDQRFILISVRGDGARLFNELLLFMKKTCTVQDLVHELENIEEMASAIGLYPQGSSKQLALPPIAQSDDFLTKVDSLIDENLGEENFKGCDIAKRLCCCEMQLYRKLKKLTNLSTANYIRRYRLYQSIYFLQQSDLPISQICFNVGFRSLEYFSRSFKEEFGVCPSDFRIGKML